MKSSMPYNSVTAVFSLNILLLSSLLKELSFQLCKWSLQAPWFITVAKANKAGLLVERLQIRVACHLSLNFNFILNRGCALGSHI